MECDEPAPPRSCDRRERRSSAAFQRRKRREAGQINEEAEEISRAFEALEGKEAYAVMDLMRANNEALTDLRAAGYSIKTDDEFVDAFSRHYRVSRDTARLMLTGGDDVIDVAAR